MLIQQAQTIERSLHTGRHSRFQNLTQRANLSRVSLSSVTTYHLSPAHYPKLIVAPEAIGLLFKRLCGWVQAGEQFQKEQHHLGTQLRLRHYPSEQGAKPIGILEVRVV
jgi:hypothetical protein